MKSLSIGFSSSMKYLSIKIVFIGLLSGCVGVSHKNNSEAMYIQASALTKLSKAVEVTVRYENPPANLSDEELLKLSTTDDPGLLDPFDGYTLKINRDFNHAIVLVCSSDGTQGLLEDAGCTADLDNPLWKQTMPCAFTLSSETTCFNK
ncbi:hypothetical protein [Methylotenera sp. 1P/1]|uniref:hypothetical protein n=1 Tax=Methylotenera sp. 1P/1 TaxID=1131551 RepID=UPI000377B43B|nr:hypothetical protein [Methylotenera sp. 1P/1]